MTDADLFAMVDRRSAAYRDMPAGPLGSLSPAERARADRLSSEFRQLDAVIVAELCRRSRPATWNGRQLRLVQHRDAFVECDPASGEPIIYRDRRDKSTVAMHDYGRPVTKAGANR